MRLLLLAVFALLAVGTDAQRKMKKRLVMRLKKQCEEEVAACGFPSTKGSIPCMKELKMADLTPPCKKAVQTLKRMGKKKKKQGMKPGAAGGMPKVGSNAHIKATVDACAAETGCPTNYKTGLKCLLSKDSNSVSAGCKKYMAPLMKFVADKQASIGNDPAALIKEVCPTIACDLPKADDPQLSTKLRCFQSYMDDSYAVVSSALGSACTSALRSTLTPLIRVAAQPKISAAEQRAIDKYKMLAASCPEIPCPIPSTSAEMKATLQCVQSVDVTTLSAGCKSALGIRAPSGHDGHDHGPGSDHDGHDHGSHAGMTHQQYMASQQPAPSP